MVLSKEMVRSVHCNGEGKEPSDQSFLLVKDREYLTA